MLLDRCDCCSEVREIKYCEETDMYHCVECEDDDKRYKELYPREGVK